MSKLIKWFKEEFLRLLPVILFFFIAFSLANISRIILHKTTDATYYSFLVIAFAALMMGKIVFISDHLPFINKFSHKPLIYTTLWKTGIYWVCSFIVLILDHLIPAYLEDGKWEVDYQQMCDSLGHPHFWVSFCWLGFLLVIFVGYRELINAVGSDKVRKLFFG